jgi:hypothetical protein
MSSENSYSTVSSTNFWFLVLLLLALAKAIQLGQKAYKTVESGDFESPLRVMTSAEPLNLPNSNGNSPHDGPVEPTQSFDSSIFRSYLLSLLPPVLGASQAELDSIFDDEFDDRVSRFAAEGGAVIYVVKVKDETEGEWKCYV